MKKLYILISQLIISTTFSCASFAQSSDDFWGSFEDKTVGSHNYYLFKQTLQTRFRDHKPHRALDLGAGAGNVSVTLADRGWDVTAIDSSKRAGEIITERSKSLPGHIAFQLNSFSKMKLNGNYDLVISISALPFGNKDNLHSIMRNISRHTKPGAVFAANFFAEDSTYVKQKYTYAMSKSELASLLKHYGFKITYFLNRKYSDKDLDNDDVTWDILDVIAVKADAQQL